MQIFRDESGRRAFWTRSFARVFGFAAIAFVAMLTFLILKKPPLSELHESKLAADLHRTASFGRTFRSGPPLSRQAILRAPQRAALRYAFYSPSDMRSFSSLQKYADRLDGIFMYWADIGINGALEKRYLQEQTKALQWISHHAPALKKYAVITSEQSARLFSGQNLRGKKARELATLIRDELKSAGFDGLLLDFESTNRSNAPAIADLAKQLRVMLSETGYQLASTATASDDFKYFLPVINAVDFVVLNSHASASGASPMPSQRDFERQLKVATALVPRQKLVVGIGSYALIMSDEGVSELTSVYHAWALSNTASAPLSLDSDLIGAFEYTKAQRTRFKVRLLDGVTAFNHTRAALAQRVGGIALWRLGIEDASAWHVVAKNTLPDGHALNNLQTLEGAADLSGQIYGSIFSVSQVGKQGHRVIQFDSSRGLIVNESMTSPPVSFAASNWGKRPQNLVALSFDDGPDEKYTPKILDILKEHDAKATFFVIGHSAIAHPQLFARIHDEGHDIGNHTFSHPDLSTRSGFEIEMELNATQRVLEKLLNVRTHLFRAPYSSVSYETSNDGLRVLDRASRLGYVSLRVNIDPYDWANITSEMIVERIFLQIAALKEPSNLVILLHDGGGNRKQTIQALPIIIDRLKRSGYTFVAARDLLPAPHSALMSATSEGEHEAPALAILSGVGLDLYRTFLAALPFIAVLTIGMGLARTLFVCTFAFVHTRTEAGRRTASWHPRISVIIPAYNEEKVIRKTIESVRASSCKDIDIIVVDDGSTDKTAATLKAAYTKNEITLFTVPNAGKASALNFGVSKTDAEIVVAIDADTVLDHHAIERLGRHFEDPTVGAVAGKAVVGNENSIMAKFQALEYITSQNLDRRAFEYFNAIGVVPGAIGAWRRSALVSAGGFREDTLAEDADATISIERNGYRVLYEPDAIARTEAPESVKAFLKQRFRWMFGTLQVAYKHRAALLSPRTPGIGFITLPNIILFQIGFTLLAPIFDALLLLNLASMARDYAVGDEVGSNFSMLAIYWVVFQLVDALMVGLACIFDGKESPWRFIPHLLIQRFFYRQLLYIVAVRTLFAAIAGTFVGWGKLVRTGNVAAKPA